MTPGRDGDAGLAGGGSPVGLPWRIDLRGVQIGELLDEFTQRRLLLTPEPADDWPVGSCSWTNPDGDFGVVTLDGRVLLINLRDTASVNGADLVGAEPDTVEQLLGAPDTVDEVGGTISFQSGSWELEVGFWDDRVSWVTVSTM